MGQGGHLNGRGFLLPGEVAGFMCIAGGSQKERERESLGSIRTSEIDRHQSEGSVIWAQVLPLHLLGVTLNKAINHCGSHLLFCKL